MNKQAKKIPAMSSGTAIFTEVQVNSRHTFPTEMNASSHCSAHLLLESNY